MLKVDIHTHILPPTIPKFKDKFGYGGFIELHQHANCCGADMVDDSGKFFRKVEPNADKILNYLRTHDGQSDLTDKSNPEDIYETFEMSKKVFKKALGSLYKQRIITIEADGIKLIEE